MTAASIRHGDAKSLGPGSAAVLQRTSREKRRLADSRIAASSAGSKARAYAKALSIAMAVLGCTPVRTGSRSDLKYAANRCAMYVAIGWTFAAQRTASESPPAERSSY